MFSEPFIPAICVMMFWSTFEESVGIFAKTAKLTSINQFFEYLKSPQLRLQQIMNKNRIQNVMFRYKQLISAVNLYITNNSDNKFAV